MPDPSSRRARAGGLLLGALLLLAALAPAASALDVSVKAMRVAGSNVYNPDTIQTYAGEVEGGPPAFDGSGIAIAVLDTGVDDGHPTFNRHFRSWVAGAELKPSCDDNGCFRERDALNPEQPHNPDDVSGHGTHVASIALGQGAGTSDPEGERLPRGVAPGASLVEVKIASDLGSASSEDIKKGIDWVIRYNKGETNYGFNGPKVKVIIVSLGTVEPHESKERTPAMQAIARAHEAGILVVAAAGNCGPGDGDVSIGCTRTGEGRERNTITAPGAAPEALAVGAIDDQGTVTRNEDRVAGYSSRGPNPADTTTDTKWRKPDVVAPGTNIGAACHSSLPGDQEGRRDQVCVKSGTSMAAPHAAGLAAILFQAGTFAKPSIGFTPDKVKELMTSTAEDLGEPGWDIVSGYGYVDGYAALVQAINRPPHAEFWTNPPQVEVGQEVTFDGSQSHDHDDQDQLARFVWDFGDGSDPEESPPENPITRHTYQAAGTYTVTLTVHDSRGATDSLKKNVQVKAPPPEDPGDPPVPEFVFEPEAPRVDETVTFDASASKDPEGKGIIKYQWDFAYDPKKRFVADVESGEPTAEWSFPNDGAVRVGLRVVDGDGLSAIKSQLVKVIPPPPGPAEVRFTNPQEGDTVRAGPILASWIVEEGRAESYTLYLDSVEDATLSARQVRIDVGPGEHTLRVVARGPGGTSSAWVNFTAEEDLATASTSNDTQAGQTGCATHTHADGTREQHCEQQRKKTCRLVAQGDGTTKEECRLDWGQGGQAAKLDSQDANDTPFPSLLSLLAAGLVALLRRRR